MRWRPLRGRVIVTRITQVTSDVLIIPDSYKDERSVRTADRGVVLAAGEPPEKWVSQQFLIGEQVFYLGPAEKLAIVWNDTVAYAVTYDEILGVIE